MMDALTALVLTALSTDVACEKVSLTTTAGLFITEQYQT